MSVKTLLAAVGIATVTMFAHQAMAANITNNDAAAHTVSIDDHGAASSIEVAANTTVKICENGCKLVLGESELEVGAKDEVEIADGKLSISE